MDTTTNRTKQTIKFFSIYGLQFLFMYAAYGIIGTTLMIHLTDGVGFGYTKAASIVSLGMLICIFVLPMVGILSDKTRRHKYVFISMLVITLIITYLYTLEVNLFFVFLMGVLYQVFRGTLMPLDDSIVSVEGVDQGYSYSHIRLIGSLGYILGGAVGGQIYAMTETTVSCYYASFIAMLISLLIVIFFYPKEISAKEEKKPLSIKKDLPKVLRNPHYIFIVLAVCLSFGISDSATQFNQTYLTDLGLPKGQFGLINLCMAGLELILLPFMFIFIRKLGIINCLRVALLACIARMLISGLTDSPYIFLGALTLHGITLAFGLPVVIHYINKYIGKEINATAILFYSATYTGMKALNTFVIGALQDKGVQMTEIFLGTAAIVSVLLFVSIFVKEPAELVTEESTI